MLRGPLVLRYALPEPRIWINASIAFNEISRLGFSIVRESINDYDDIWYPYADAVNHFIFCKNRGQPFNADERRKYEFHDCQMVDTIRSQILTHADIFPWDFMQRIIDILNHASVITLDNADIMGKFLLSTITYRFILTLAFGSVMGNVAYMVNI